MLLRFYPLEKAALDARLQASLATVTDDSEAKNALSWGGLWPIKSSNGAGATDTMFLHRPMSPAPTHGRGNSRLQEWWRAA